MASNTNLAGAGRASGHQMLAFDKLPPTAREALRYAAHDWAATTILARFRRGVRGYKSGAEIAMLVRHWDARQHKADVKRGVIAP